MSELVGTNSFIALGTNGLAAAAAFSDLVQGLMGLEDSLQEESSVEVALRLAVNYINGRGCSLRRITKFLFFINKVLSVALFKERRQSSRIN